MSHYDLMIVRMLNRGLLNDEALQILASHRDDDGDRPC
jgi:hypothetical protein